MGNKHKNIPLNWKSPLFWSRLQFLTLALFRRVSVGTGGLNPLKRAATHLWLLWCCGCPWGALLAYHQAIQRLPLSHKKKLNETTSTRSYCQTWRCSASVCTTRTESCSGSASCRWMGCRPATGTSRWGLKPTSPCRCPCCSVTSSSRSTCRMALKVIFNFLCICGSFD